MLITEIIWLTAKKLRTNFLLLSKALLLPFSMSLVIAWSDAAAPGLMFNDWRYSVAMIIASLVIYTWVAVATHRGILFENTDLPKWRLPTWTIREWLFLWYWILSGVIIITLFTATFFITSSINLLYSTDLMAALAIGVWLIGAWLIGRISFVFPAIAIDNKANYSLSWEQSKGHNFVMFLIISLPLIIGYAISLLPLQDIASIWIWGTAFPLIEVVGIALLSAAYQVIVLDNSKAPCRSNTG